MLKLLFLMVTRTSKSKVIGTSRFGDTIGGLEIIIGIHGTFEGRSLRDFY